MRVLYTSDYRCEDIKRRREIRSVINCNIRNKYIDKIVILWENWDKYSSESEYDYLKNPKVEVVNWNKRQTYQDFYQHSLKYYPNDIIIVSNSDIIFDHTISRTQELLFNDRRMYAITRYEPVNINKDFYNTPLQGKHDQCWSFDTYIWKHPLNVIPETLDINVGIGGCDSYLIKKLVVDNLIEVKNVMLDIRCWHRDYRQEEGLNKDYTGGYNYNQREDYPRYMKSYNIGIQHYGGDKGLEFLPIGEGDSFILSSPPQYKHNMKVISFSLYGNKEKYLKGAIKNADVALDIYPEWECWFYVHKSSVPESIVSELKAYPNVKIIFKDELVLPMTWRFLPLDNPNVEYTISRDADSLISERERSCVEEWLRSSKRFHIIRDHPHHEGLMVGMIGFKKMPYFKGWDTILPKFVNRTNEWGIDLKIIQQAIYTLASKYDDIFVSATFHKTESCSRDIPIPYDDKFEFIGEYWSETEEGRVKEHIETIKKELANGPQVIKSKRMNLDYILINTFKDDKEIQEFVSIYSGFIQNKTKIAINRLKPIEDIPNNFVKRMANVFIPCIIQVEDCIMLCSDEVFPKNSSFLLNIPKRFDNDRIVIHNDSLINQGCLSTWFNIAVPKVWSRVLGFSQNLSFENVVKSLWDQKISPEQLLYKKVMQFQEETGRAIILDNDYINF